METEEQVKSPFKNGGRPTKLTPLVMDKICMMAAFGMPDEKIAYCVGIDQDTFTRWKKNDIFYGLLQKAKENPLQEVETSLFLRAKGAKIMRRQVNLNAKGEKVSTSITEENLPPDTGACIAILANKKPREWKRDPDKAVSIDRVENLIVYLPEVKDEKAFLETHVEKKEIPAKITNAT